MFAPLLKWLVYTIMLVVPLPNGERGVGVQEGFLPHRHHAAIVQTKTFLKCIFQAIVLQEKGY